MECSDGSGLSSRVYNGREDGVMGPMAAWRVSSTNGHVRPCNLKPQQRDLTLVLRRSVEPTANSGQLNSFIPTAN
jgi:hypothetical protein